MYHPSNRVFHYYKPSILGYPYFWKHPQGSWWVLYIPAWCRILYRVAPPLLRLMAWHGSVVCQSSGAWNAANCRSTRGMDDTNGYILYIYILYIYNCMFSRSFWWRVTSGPPDWQAFWKHTIYIYIYVGLTRKIVPSSKFHGFFWWSEKFWKIKFL